MLWVEIWLEVMSPTSEVSALLSRWPLVHLELVACVAQSIHVSFIKDGYDNNSIVMSKHQDLPVLLHNDNRGLLTIEDGTFEVLQLSSDGRRGSLPFAGHASL